MNTSMTNADPALPSVQSVSPADSWRIAVVDARALTGEILKIALNREFWAETYANVQAWRDDTRYPFSTAAIILAIGSADAADLV